MHATVHKLANTHAAHRAPMMKRTPGLKGRIPHVCKSEAVHACSYFISSTTMGSAAWTGGHRGALWAHS